MKTLKAIESIRSDDNFTLFWEKTAKNARDVSVDEPHLPRRRRMPNRFEARNAPAEFHDDIKTHYRQIYFESIDHLVSAISSLYDSPDFNLYMQSEQLLLKCCKKIDYQSEFETVAEFYGGDFNKENLKLQLVSLAENFEYCGDINDITLTDIITYIKSMTPCERKWIKDVQALLKKLLVMPATNATSERAFSSLRRVKTYLWATMKQERLNGLMVMNVHQERLGKINLVDIANEFVSRSEKRYFTFGKFVGDE